MDWWIFRNHWRVAGCIIIHGFKTNLSPSNVQSRYNHWHSPKNEKVPTVQFSIVVSWSVERWNTQTKLSNSGRDGILFCSPQQPLLKPGIQTKMWNKYFAQLESMPRVLQHYCKYVMYHWTSGLVLQIVSHSVTTYISASASCQPIIIVYADITKASTACK